MKIFLISDLHMKHNNLILRGVRSRFKDCEEHDSFIKTNWNNAVSKEDLVYILGDCFWDRKYEIFNELNGQKIVIKGNHDSKENLQRAKSSNYIANWHYYKGFMHNNDYVFLIHFPMLSWDRAFHGSYHFYGHVHGSLQYTKGRSMDVSVDAINYTPILLDDAINKLKYRDNKYFYNAKTGEKMFSIDGAKNYE